jgi:hypothetical protein
VTKPLNDPILKEVSRGGQSGWNGMAYFAEITFRVGFQQMKVEGTNHNFVL